MTKIAVLLAAYNGRKWIDEQISSINNQSKVEVDIYISVDLSDDGTFDWCEEKFSSSENVFLLEYGARFGGAARNFYRLIKDVDFLQYDYVALSDQDDIWLEDKLFNAISTIEKHDLDAFSSDVLAFWEDGREKFVRKSFPQQKFDFFFEAAGPGCTYVFKQESLQIFKLFLIKYWESVNEVSLHDWLIYAFFRAKKMKWHIASFALMRYRQHEHNQVGYNSGIRAALKRLKMIKSKWYANEVAKIYALLKNFPVSSQFSTNRMFLLRHFRQLRRSFKDSLLLLILILLRVY